MTRAQEEHTPDLRPWREPVAGLGWASVAALVVINILNAYVIVVGPWESERYWLLMEGESNPSTWFSVTALVLTSAIAGVCAVIDRDHSRFWSICGLVVLAMSFDDAAMVHERVGGNLSAALDRESELAYLWVVPWLVAAAAVTVVLWRSRPRLPRRTHRGLLLGGTMIVVAATLLELVASTGLQQYGDGETPKLLLFTLEENLEVIGVLVLARAMWQHALEAAVPTGGARSATPTLGA